MDLAEYNYNKRYSKNIQVYVQISSSEDLNWEHVKICEDKKSLYVRYVQDFARGNTNIIPHFWNFKTDGVLYNRLQNDIYETVTEGLLERALMGNNVIILAYGQTGTGKSLTINGLQNSYNNRGISLRIISDLFMLKNKMKQEADIKYEVSFVEVRKTYIKDLLQDDQTKLYSPYKNIRKVTVKSELAAFRKVFKGEVRRSVSPKSPYTSHTANSVLTIHIKNISLLNSNPIETYSKIYIVDMSGADTGGNLSCIYKDVHDVGEANLAKSQLEQLLLVLHNQYARTKKILRGLGPLVEYLSDSLRPHSLIRFISHIRTTKDDLHVTLSLLRFAHIAQCMAPAKLKPFVMTSEKLEIENMKKELNFLIKQNHLNAMIMNYDLTQKVSEARVAQMENAIEDFIKNQSNDITVMNVSDARAVLSIFKNVYNKQEQAQMENVVMLKDEITKLRIQLASSSTTSKDKSMQSISRESGSIRKKKISEKRSSIRSVEIRSKKSSRVGSVKSSGFSIGQFKSTNFQGNVTKSKKGSSHMRARSKKSSKSSVNTVKNITIPTNAKQGSKMTLNEYNGESALKMSIKDYEEAWQAFTHEEEYEHLQDMLINSERESKENLEKYNEMVKKIQDIIQLVDDKKEYQLKLQIFKDNKDLVCTSDQNIKISETEKTINDTIMNLINELTIDKENLLSLQADLKINIDNYHRIKKNISEKFSKFCVGSYNLNLTNAEQILCIEDKLLSLLSDKKSITIHEAEDVQKILFYKLQSEMRKTYDVRQRKFK